MHERGPTIRSRFRAISRYKFVSTPPEFVLDICVGDRNLRITLGQRHRRLFGCAVFEYQLDPGAAKVRRPVLERRIADNLDFAHQLPNSGIEAASHVQTVEGVTAIAQPNGDAVWQTEFGSVCRSRFEDAADNFDGGGIDVNLDLVDRLQLRIAGLA